MHFLFNELRKFLNFSAYLSYPAVTEKSLCSVKTTDDRELKYKNTIKKKLAKNTDIFLPE